MGWGPWEARQDADELRAGVETVTSGPGGSGMGEPHQCRWEEVFGALLYREGPDKSKELRTDCRKESFLHHMCGSEGHFGSRLCSALHHGSVSGSLLPALSVS